MSLVEEVKKVLTTTSVSDGSSSGSTAGSVVASNPIETTASTPSTTQIANDFSTTDIHTQTKAEEEKEKEKKNQQYNSSLPLWYQADTYKDEDEGKDTTTITNEDVSEALNEIVAFELSEKGKEDTVFYSDNYYQGFTNNGKVINGSCTEGGMRKAIVGGSKYITVTNSDGVTMSGVEAMADSYDSVLDLYTQSQFEKVLEEYGYGTFSNNNNFIKHVDEIREKYGIDIKEVATQNPDGTTAIDGISHRTFEISLIDENGNIIEDAEGNKSTILFGDWVIPDGTAQGAEFDFISVIDQAGYDCISKADFMNNEAFAANPEFQDANGNYDAGKAYAHVLGQIETELGNLKSGKGSDLVKASEQTINEATYVSSTFTWWSAGGNGQYYSNSGLNPTTAGEIDADLVAKYDVDGDGDLNEDELKTMIENEVEDKDGAEKDKAKGATVVDNSDNQQATGGVATVSVQDIMDEAQKGFETRLDELKRENPEMTEDEIIYQAADELAKKYDLEANDIIDTYKY